MLSQYNWISFKSYTLDTHGNTQHTTFKLENETERKRSTCWTTHTPLRWARFIWCFASLYRSQYSKSDIIWLHRCTHCVSSVYRNPCLTNSKACVVLYCLVCHSLCINVRLNIIYILLYIFVYACINAVCLFAMFRFSFAMLTNKIGFGVPFLRVQNEKKNHAQTRFSIDLSIFISVSQSITILYWI